jgi:hypothetical protein
MRESALTKQDLDILSGRKDGLTIFYRKLYPTFRTNQNALFNIFSAIQFENSLSRQRGDVTG